MSEAGVPGDPVGQGAGAVPADQLDRVLRLVGLGVRGGGAVVGVDRLRDAVKNDEVVVAFVAADSSVHSQDKVRPLLAARGVPTFDVPQAAELGHAVGREGTAAVGVTDPNLAKGILLTLGVALGDVRGAPVRARGGPRSHEGRGGRRRTRRMD